MRTLIVAAVMAVSLLGCNHVYFAGDGAPGETHAVRNSFFLAGLIGEARVDAHALCPQGIAAVHTYETFLDGFFSGLTLLIYTPRHVEITCVAGHASGPARVLVAQDERGRAVAAVAQDADGTTRVLPLAEVTR